MNTPKESGEAKKPDPISVAQLTAFIDSAIRAGVPSVVLVKGEISNLNHHRASGHIYFTLKDDKSCIDCVMFKTDVQKMKMIPSDGDEIVAGGSVKVYAQRGRYQLYVTTFSLMGQGALELKFQQLRKKLEEEGLFAPERKKSLPKYPQKIAIVTSKQAAALQDILKVLSNYPWLDLQIHHVPVQGVGSAEQIAAMIGTINQSSKKPDVILLGRGGGSMEDLWEFNEEAVARAVYKSKIPIVSGIGHEVDVSIADLVADYHAHTPTEAAQVIVAGWKQARSIVDSASIRLNRSLKQIIAEAKHRLVSISRHEFFRRPTDGINRQRQNLDELERQLKSELRLMIDRTKSRLHRAESRLAAKHPRAVISITHQRIDFISRMLKQRQKSILQKQSQSLQSLEKQLIALSPHGVLSRGYSITTNKKTGHVIRDAKSIRAGDVLVTQFQDGKSESIAKDPNQPELF